MSESLEQLRKQIQEKDQEIKKLQRQNNDLMADAEFMQKKFQASKQGSDNSGLIKELEDKITFMQKNIDYLQDQNYQLQSQIEGKIGDMTVKEVYDMKLELYELRQQVKESQQINEELNKKYQELVKQKGISNPIDKTPQKRSILLSPSDKDSNALKRKVQQLELELSKLKQSKNSADQPRSPLMKSKIGPSQILSQLQPKSNGKILLYLSGPPSFQSPYLEINKQKQDIKMIKQMKNGFERSCFDIHHFDFIDHDQQKLKNALEQNYALEQGNGLFDFNHLIVFHGASRTQKKNLLVNLFDIIQKQFQKQYEIFKKHQEIESIQLHITYNERTLQEQKIEQSVSLKLSQDKYQIENDKQCKDFELYIQRIKLNLLNKVKSQQGKRKQKEKVREFKIFVEKKIGNETLNSQCLIYSSSVMLGNGSYQYIEESFRDVLLQLDKGKFVVDLFQKQNQRPFQLNIILSIQPTVPQYKNTQNTLRISKIFRQPKKPDSAQQSPLKEQDDLYSSLLENQLKESENLVKNHLFKTNMQKLQIDNLSRQVENLKRQNQEQDVKNNQLRQALENFTSNLEQVYSTLTQQLSLKQKKFLQRGQYLKKNASILTFEKAQKILNNILYKCNNLKDGQMTPKQQTSMMMLQKQNTNNQDSDGAESIDEEPIQDELSQDQNSSGEELSQSYEGRNRNESII